MTKLEDFEAMKDWKVLVAEDHAGMRDCIVRILQREFQVIEAVSDGEYLIPAAIANKPDVVVSDVNMPGLGGIEAMKELIASGVNIPFVFVTANPEAISQLRNRVLCVNKADLSALLNDAVRSAAVSCYASQVPATVDAVMHY
jgi:CheY-like chemotaxis protein